MAHLPGNNHRVVSATPEELGALRQLLIAEALPHQGVDYGAGVRFLVARSPSGALLGGVGLEGSGPDALLRSLVVDPAYRSAGIGEDLVTAIERVARHRGVANLYLLTTTAAGFFLNRGYRHTDRSRVPSALQRTDEFTTLCPASADCLTRRLQPAAATQSRGPVTS